MTRLTPAIADLLQRLERLERPICHRAAPPPGGEPFRHEPGTRPLLVSAPHGAAHLRAGRPKREEEYTSALARLLARETGAHALYMTHRAAYDSNWDRDTPFKRRLREIVQGNEVGFVLDLHGMTTRHHIGLALGTINGESCPEHEQVLCEVLAAHGFCRVETREAKRSEFQSWNRYALNHPRFTGGLRHHTVTRFASRALGVPAAQVEISFSNLIVAQDASPNQAPYLGDPEAIARTAHALIAMAHALESPSR